MLLIHRFFKYVFYINLGAFPETTLRILEDSVCEQILAAIQTLPYQACSDIRIQGDCILPG